MSDFMNIFGGGGSLRVPREKVIPRAGDYCVHRWHRRITQLSPWQRQIVAYVLQQSWDFTPKELIEVFQVAKSVIYSDLKKAEYDRKHNVTKPPAKSFQWYENRLRLYIIYNDFYYIRD